MFECDGMPLAMVGFAPEIKVPDLPKAQGSDVRFYTRNSILVRMPGYTVVLQTDFQRELVGTLKFFSDHLLAAVEISWSLIKSMLTTSKQFYAVADQVWQSATSRKLPN